MNEQGTWKRSSQKLAKPHGKQTARQLARKQPKQRKTPRSTRQTEPSGPPAPGAHEGNLTTIGGVAGRLWMGTPGQSGLVSGYLSLYEQVPLPDREEVVGELKRRLTYEVARGYWKQTGLEVGPGNPILRTIEWMVLIGPPDQEAGPKLRAFCEGWSQVLPPGVRARDLTGPDIQKLARRLLGTPAGKLVRAMPKQVGDPSPEPPETPPEGAPNPEDVDRPVDT